MQITHHHLNSLQLFELLRKLVCHHPTPAIPNVRQNMHAEDFCNLDPQLSSIRFNTPCFLFLEGCCVCNPCLQVRDITRRVLVYLPRQRKCLSILLYSIPLHIFISFFICLFLSLGRSEFGFISNSPDRDSRSFIFYT